MQLGTENLYILESINNNIFIELSFFVIYRNRFYFVKRLFIHLLTINLFARNKKKKFIYSLFDIGNRPIDGKSEIMFILFVHEQRNFKSSSLIFTTILWKFMFPNLIHLTEKFFIFFLYFFIF